jgi:hypothetical protein
VLVVVSRWHTVPDAQRRENEEVDALVAVRVVEGPPGRRRQVNQALAMALGRDRRRRLDYTRARMMIWRILLTVR